MFKVNFELANNDDQSQILKAPHIVVKSEGQQTNGSHYIRPLRENFIWEQGFKGRALNSEVCRQKLNRPLTCAEGLSGT